MVSLRLSFLPSLLISAALSTSSALEQMPNEYLGAWKITEASYSAENTVELNSGGRITVSSFDDSTVDSFRVDIKVANHMTTKIKVLDEAEEGKGHRVEVGSAASTRMMPPPPLRDLEAFLITTLPQFDTIQSDNELLQLTGNGARLVCEKIGDVAGSA